LVAAPEDAEAPAADLVVRWTAETEVDDAAAALETLRAAREASRPASLVLAAGSDLGRGRDHLPAAHALRRGEEVRTAVIPLTDDVPVARPDPRAAPRLVAPAGAMEGVPVALAIDSGDVPLPAGEARLLVGGREIAAPLPEGAHRAVLPPMELTAGTHLVVAEIPGRPPAAAVVEVAGSPRVLVVGAAKGEARAVVAPLRTQGLDVVDVLEGELKREHVERAGVVVLAGGATGGALADEIAARVRQGAGLLVLGGDGKAGLCRLRGTSIDALVPIEPPEPPKPPPPPPEPPQPEPEPKPDPERPKPSVDEGKKQALRVALLLVIDTSGSMSGQKLQMAQQAAIAAAGALSPKDRVSVISFDDDPHEIVPFQDAVDQQSLYRRIAALSASGGTNFHPALKMGIPRILGERCGIRHIILLTDGETRPAVFRDLVEGAAAKGVTMSTVAVGDGADTRLLALLAEWGKGRLYLAADPTRLPEVVTLDTQRFAEEGRERVRRAETGETEGLPTPPSTTETRPPESGEQPPTETPTPPALRTPHVLSRAAILAGLEGVAWPGFANAESPRARPTSQAVLGWEDGAPALVLGRAALGRVAVLAADFSGEDISSAAGWEQAPRFLAQLVRGLAEPPRVGEGAVVVNLEETLDGRAFARVEVAGGGEIDLEPIRAGARLSLHLVDRAGGSQAELASMPPAGVFAGTFAPAKGAPRRAVATSLGPRGLDPHAPRAVAEEAGVAVVASAPPPRDGRSERRSEPIRWPFVAGAAVMLVAEAALRRAARIVA
jgi:uncharacterized protein YegL